jgi:rhamnogalacturonan endolyase
MPSSRQRLQQYKGRDFGRIEGRVLGSGDILGDWREELITSVPGELRIYSTSIPATTRRTCLLQNRRYRTSVAMQATGYVYPPQD